MQILMFVPAHKPEFITKAKSLKRKYKDLIVIYDLEDSVPEADKKTAYENVLKHAGSKDWVRIARGTYIYRLVDQVDKIVLPKCDPELLSYYDEFDRLQFVPIIETARGLEYVREVADGCSGIIFGKYDLAVSMGSDEYTDYASQRIVTACKALDVAVYNSPDYSLDPNVISYNASQSYELGFDGMCVLHPDHIKIVKDAFKPAAQDVSWAKSVLEEAKDGISVHYNCVVGPPVLERARQVLSK